MVLISIDEVGKIETNNKWGSKCNLKCNLLSALSSEAHTETICLKADTS